MTVGELINKLEKYPKTNKVEINCHYTEVIDIDDNGWADIDFVDKNIYADILDIVSKNNTIFLEASEDC